VEWNNDRDLTGWFISEKLDGVRALWDGTNLFSRLGKMIPVPLEITRTLPRDVHLDGELWLGYDTFEELNTVLRQFRRQAMDQEKLLELWKDVKFCVFDAPMHSGHYSERHSFLKDIIRQCDPHICLIPMERCLSLDHLHRVLDDVRNRGGEGLMLYHPESPYTPGRTDLVLKVKTYVEENVRFMECNPNSYSFICQQSNGATCIVKCSGWDYKHPPSHGTILTVKHLGFHKASQKMKYPVLLRIGADLEG